jgi:hypothetical protein
MAQQTKNLFRNMAEVGYQGDTYHQQQKAGYCGVCGKRTNYKSVFAAEYCCSEECSKELWHDIFVKLMSDRRRNR